MTSETPTPDGEPGEASAPPPQASAKPGDEGRAERGPRDEERRSPERPAGRGREGGGREGGRRERRGRRPRRKVCAFCVDKVTRIGYKDYGRLREFVSDRGKILKSRQTGTCAAHQRKLARAIKRARHIALLPFVSE